MAKEPQQTEEACSEKEPKQQKPKLAITEQITHLKSKGVKFAICDEEEATSFLADVCDFYEATSYRKLFTKRQGGKHDGEYIDLDFAQLKAFFELDQTLRETLFPMTQHIEHAWKVALKRAVADRDGEDGYSIVVDYMGSLSPKDRKYRDGEIKRSSRNPYAHGVYEKYADCMPVWAFLELTSFGTLADFVRFCGNRWGDKSLVRAHYDLKKVKSVRNCAAHGSCIINVFAEGENSRHTTSVDTLDAVARVSLSKATRKKWMRNAAAQEIAITLVRYSKDVRDAESKEKAERWLKGFFDEVRQDADLLPQTGPDATSAAAFNFMEALTKSLGLIK